MIMSILFIQKDQDKTLYWPGEKSTTCEKISLSIHFVGNCFEKNCFADFKSSRKLEKFYKLQLNHNVCNQEDLNISGIKTKDIMEVEESFKSLEDIYFKS